MNFNKFLIIPVLALFPAITACGNACKSSCDDANACAGVTTKKDCGSYCDKSQTLAEDANCSSQYDDFVSCVGDMDDVCNEKDTSCDAKGTAFFGCVLPYCMKTANAAQCKDVGVDLSSATP